MLNDYEFTVHAKTMMSERGIMPTWVSRTLSEPDKMERQADGTVHYLKSIGESDGRFLRVVVNVTVTPPRVVTQFFDRRAGRAK